MYEWTRANKNNILPNKNIQAGFAERIHQVMNVAVTRELENIEKNIGFLATVDLHSLYRTFWNSMGNYE